MCASEIDLEKDEEGGVVKRTHLFMPRDTNYGNFARFLYKIGMVVA